MKIEFYVGGTPRPKGSGSRGLTRGGKLGRYVESADQPTTTRPRGALKFWSSMIETEAHCAARKAGLPHPWDEPVRVALVFYTEKSPDKRGSGDIDKLSRAVLDAMESVIYTDDARVVDLMVEKRPEDDGDPGVWVSVQPCEVQE